MATPPTRPSTSRSSPASSPSTRPRSTRPTSPEPRDRRDQEPYSTGSCQGEDLRSIEHVAHISDELNLPAVFILDFGDVISDDEVRYIKELGRINSVLVLTKTEATRKAMLEGVTRIHKQRTALLKNRLAPRGAYKPTSGPRCTSAGSPTASRVDRQLGKPLVPLAAR